MSTSRLTRLGLTVAVVALVLPLGVSPALAQVGVPTPDAPVVGSNADETATRTSSVSHFGSVAVNSGGARALSPTPGLEAAVSGVVTGRIRADLGAGEPSVPATSDNTVVRFWRDHGDGYFLEGTAFEFDAGGNFSIDGLRAGNYRVEVLTLDTGSPGKEYWQDQSLFVDANTVTLSEGLPTAIPTIIVSPIVMSFGRISGADRFATAVEISKSITGLGGVDVVYLANGIGYADALSAGPAAAASGGVLLLTLPTAVPTVVRDELVRLNPERVVLVGGVGAISSSVENVVSGLLPEADVDRMSGVDRYATARAIIADAWPEGNNNVAIATGRNFPDALAAGAAIGSLGGAVLLVDGSLPSLDLPSRAFLDALQPQFIAVAGGTGSVSDGILSGLQAVSSEPGVQRFGGTNRYETAERLNNEFFGLSQPDFAFVATGTGFADALSGGPLAILSGAPIYLSSAQCLTVETFTKISNLYVQEVYGLGGPGALSDRVLYGTFC